MTDEQPSSPVEDQNTSLKEFSTTSPILKDDDVFNADKHQPNDMPERVDELNEIHSAIEPVARGATPRNLFLYGKPGQGKTAGVKIKRDQFERFAAENDLNVDIVYIECNSANKTYHVLTTALKKLKNLDEKPSGYPLDTLYSMLFEYMNTHGGTYIFILDEIDRIRDDQDDELNILYKLPRAFSSEELDDDVGCSVIGISNDRRFKEDLSPRIKDALYDTEVDFAPYSKAQLEQILYRRAAKGLHNTTLVYDDGEIAGVESETISEDVIAACAENAERERGSARQAIDLLGQAAADAHDERVTEIKMEHVRRAQREVNKNYIKNMLNDHTLDDLLTLCGLLYLEAQDRTPARTTDVHRWYTKYAEAVGENPLVQRRMRDRLQDLDLNGVIDMRKTAGGTRGGERWESALSIPLDETIEILGEDEEYRALFGNIITEIESEARSSGKL